MVAFDARWICFQWDLEVLVWEGKSEPLGKLFLVCCSIAGKREDKEKNSFSFAWKYLNLGTFIVTERQEMERIFNRAHWVTSARKTNPKWLKKRNV